MASCQPSPRAKNDTASPQHRLVISYTSQKKVALFWTIHRLLCCFCACPGHCCVESGVQTGCPLVFLFCDYGGRYKWAMNTTRRLVGNTRSVSHKNKYTKTLKGTCRATGRFGATVHNTEVHIIIVTFSSIRITTPTPPTDNRQPTLTCEGRRPNKINSYSFCSTIVIDEPHDQVASIGSSVTRHDMT